MSPTAEYFTQAVIQGVVVLTVVGLFTWSLRRDPRALRNGFLLVITGYAVLEYIGFLLSWSSALTLLTQAVSSAVFLFLLLSTLLLPFALVWNGGLMVRREGRSLGNLLSLLAGLALLAVPVVAFILVRNENRVTDTLLVALFVAQVLVGFLFLAFLAQALLYSRVVKRLPASAVIILGSGLVQGRVPPLLAARLRTAIEAATTRGTKDHALLLVPSGGQGQDEPRPEGEAMGEWLQNHGISAEQIVVESHARTTEENLQFSKTLLEERGTIGPYLIATNNYHAARAAMIARELKIDAHAIGARTAPYFLPSAFLREFIAVMSRRRVSLALCAAVVLVAAVLSWMSLGA